MNFRIYGTQTIWDSWVGCVLADPKISKPEFLNPKIFKPQFKVVKN